MRVLSRQTIIVSDIEQRIIIAGLYLALADAISHKQDKLIPEIVKLIEYMKESVK